MPIGSVREPGAANQVLEPGIAVKRQVPRPDNGASYFWRTTTYDFLPSRSSKRQLLCPMQFLRTTAPRRKRLQKREATRSSARAAFVLLKSSLKKRIRSGDIPPSLRMSGQFCANRDLN